ncbi:related to negative transcription regulator [Cephalotrichum gorgonifer]|uniref:Mediator of RNA polymerase II transcription subunit 10 n=1 Tax=Cephalotrichum gorgonifer TaxID=2041049 RepID=A0AAE8MWY6_9PEZI|nr:related to negative transcription regulator [Cephalotrichum gorgonifer]
MAPVQSDVHAELEAQIKDVIQDLFKVMVVTSHYDTSGRPSREVLTNSFKTLSTSLQTINATATDPTLTLPQVPPELVKYVEGGRNPDIYTREFVELVRRGNQLVRGKMRAFETFRDVLAGEMSSAMPELKADVDRVVEATKGEGRTTGSD